MADQISHDAANGPHPGRVAILLHFFPCQAVEVIFDDFLNDGSFSIGPEDIVNFRGENKAIHHVDVRRFGDVLVGDLFPFVIERRSLTQNCRSGEQEQRQ